ncbi:MAG: AraC family transcriptional regulator [Lachnospiraceae bacterium]|nr:AraC family transcriptional regulator [Lachnospiraceae bacterium]
MTFDWDLSEKTSNEQFQIYMQLISKKDSDSTYHMNAPVGEGIMRSFHIAPGVELVYSELERYNCIYTDVKRMVKSVEIMYMIDGTIELEMETHRFVKANKGDIAIMGNQIGANKCIVGAGGIRCMSLILFLDESRETLNEFLHTKDFQEDNFFPNIEHDIVCFPATPRLDRIFQELLHLPPEHASHYQYLLCMEAMLLLADRRNSKESSITYFNQLTRDKVHAARRLLSNHLSEDLSIDVLSDQVHLNRTTLQKLFKEIYGVTIYEYRKQIRIQEAKNRLVSTTDSITEIAGTCGYSNSSKFSDAFKKVTGCLPSQWRNQYRTS